MVARANLSDESFANRTMTKVTGRLLPLAIALYFVSYIDRSNLSVAALTMNKDLGLTPSQFGLGGAFFFIGYFLLQVPGTLALERWGARRVISVVAFFWGICAIGMAWIHGSTSFYSTRLLLGLAEAPLFPGMILYIATWFPAQWRGRVIALFMVASPLSNVVGLPISAVLLKLNGDFGLRGWQWMFLVEGLPAILLSVIVLVWMTDRPAVAKWLTLEERQWLVSALEAESKSRLIERTPSGVGTRVRDALQLRTLVLALGYFGIMAGLYGFGLWLPQIVRRFGYEPTQTGFIAAAPYFAAAAFMTYWGRRLDRKGDRGWHAAVACFLGALGLFLASILPSIGATLGALTLAAMGLHAAMPTFWTIPTSLFKGSAGAVGISLVSALGMLGGFVGPYIVGVIREATGNFTIALGCLAAPVLLSAIIAWCFRDRGRASAPARSDRGTSCA
jgi:ACS family tartrate transporter-like MFS transporter